MSTNITENYILIRFMLFLLSFSFIKIIYYFKNEFKLPLTERSSDSFEKDEILKKNRDFLQQTDIKKNGVPDDSSKYDSGEEGTSKRKRSEDSPGEGSSKRKSSSEYVSVITPADYEPASDSENNNEDSSEDKEKMRYLLEDNVDPIDRLMQSNSTKFESTLNGLTNEELLDVVDRIDKSIEQHKIDKVPASKDQIIELEKKKEMCEKKLDENFAIGQKEEEGKGKEVEGKGKEAEDKGKGKAK